LTIASVIGREFELRQLAPLIEDVSEDRMLEVLEEALAARVVEELPSTVGRYQFTHALIQETLAEELSTTRRVRLHARIAEALEELYGADAESHAAELAHHFAEAEGVLGTDKLIRYSLLAGERTMAIYAYEEALAHFQRGLTAKEGETTQWASSMDSETAALLHGLGRTQLVMLQVEEGWANLTRAFDYYAEVGDIARVVDIADNQVSIAAPGNVAPLLARALELVPRDSYEAGRLLPWYGRLLNRLEGDYDGARDALDRGLAIAQREGDVALQMQALAWSADMEASHFHWHEALEKARQVIELTSHADNPLAELFANMHAGAALAAMGGDKERLRQHSEAMLAAAERLHDRVWLPLALGNGSARYSSWGEWQSARELSDRGLALAPRNPLILLPRILLEYEVGDFEQGEIYLERLIDVVSAAVPGSVAAIQIARLIPEVARITGASDRFEIAEAAAEAILAFPSVTPGNSGSARVGLAIIAVQRADASAASEQYAALQALQDFWGPGSSMSPERVLGHLAQTMGNLNQAMSHFEDALAFSRKSDYRPELAWTCCDYADMLLERKGEGDRAKAMSLLDESLAISSELGMRPLMERVLSRREILGA
jgi:tetratricopeptide (TPR) repeat protein